MKLFLVRHGQTVANETMHYSGQSDTPLTELGRQQAMSIRPILEKIPFDKVYSSDLSRAIDTQMLALPGHTGERLPLLREINTGSLTGRFIPEAKQEMGEMGKLLPKIGYTQFGGESSQQLCDRAREFLKLLEKEPRENVIAFAHNGFLCATLQAVLGGEIDRGAAASRNCAIHVFAFENGKWYLRAWNYMKEV